MDMDVIDCHGVRYIAYHAYDIGEIDIRKNSQIFAIEFRGLTGHIRWTPKYFSRWDHIDFYAGCDGWQPVTGTGYHSFIVPHELDTTEAMIVNWFADQCRDYFPADHQHQCCLF